MEQTINYNKIPIYKLENGGNKDKILSTNKFVISKSRGEEKFEARR